MFKKLGIVVRRKNFKSIDHDALDTMIAYLSDQRVDLFSEMDADYKNDHIIELSHEDFISNADLIVVFGGDGTLLNAARHYIEANIPLLGINMGNLGFLTDIKINNFEKSISEILNGDYKTEERFLISAIFDGKTSYGLNEVVIHSGSYAQLMTYRLSINEKVVYEQKSDGLIVATPTGSTAYALSAGGPIIHPELNVWTILPMLPQSLSSRPFVISSSDNVEVIVFDGPQNDAKICIDGQEDISFPFDTKVKISKMNKLLKLVHPKSNDFFEACREKLGWSLNITKR